MVKKRVREPLKKVIENTYEFSPKGNRASTRDEAFAKVMRDASAANDLGIPFSIVTQHGKAFRGGGNVTKAPIERYVVRVGEIEDVGDDL